MDDQLNPEELGAYFALVTAGDLVQKAVTASLHDHGLTPVQFSILATLSDHADGLRMSELADALVVSRGGLTYQVTQLEKSGLVERAAHAGDDRGVVAHLTEEGRARLSTAFPEHVALVRENLLDLLEPQEVATLGAILARVVGHLRGGA